MLLSHTPTHVIALKSIRIRRYHIKAALAYGGAFLMGADAMVALAPVLFPHAVAAFKALEASATVCGKCGGAVAGFSVFFDQIVESTLPEQVA